MGKLKSLIAGTLLGAGGMYFGLQYHLLQADEGFLIVPRMPQQRLQDTYADVRDWDAATWTARPQLALAVTQHGRGDLISEDVASNVLDNLRESIAPVQQRLDQAARGWEPTTSSRIPPAGEPRAQKSPPVDEAQPRRGFLPLAELFGINAQSPSPQEDTAKSSNAPSNTTVLPAGSTTPKRVEILPPPGEFETLQEPDDVQLGPAAPIPGSKHSMDRRRSDATGWEPLTVNPY